MNDGTRIAIIAGAGVVIGLGVIYTAAKVKGALAGPGAAVGDALQKVGDAVRAGVDAAGTFITETVNPASPNNAAYTAYNAYGAKATGNPNFNLGAMFWEMTHPSQRKAEDAAIGIPAPTPSDFDAYIAENHQYA